ncbi:MAG: hypothetical protein O7F16_11160, partial [Acidobacteria bacterium]|nr:hypothetical protein [Acidobacteriota bacterium]
MAEHLSHRAGAVLLVLSLLAGSLTTVLAEEVIPSIGKKTRGMEKLDGFLPLYWDSGEGKLYLEVARFDEELIYFTSLVTGVGSNDIGLDRSQLGSGRLVRFEKVGPRVLLVQLNDRFRAESPSPDERRAVEVSFARSVLGDSSRWRRAEAACLLMPPISRSVTCMAQSVSSSARAKVTTSWMTHAAWFICRGRRRFRRTPRSRCRSPS